jgi:hypothetical protein
MEAHPMSTAPLFRPGSNIAMKVPAASFDATVAFYAGTLRLDVISGNEASVVLDFAGKQLWLDRAEGITRAGIWLEIVTSDLAAASAHLAAHGVERCDEVEPLPDGMAAFWIKNPAGVVHLMAAEPG